VIVLRQGGGCSSLALERAILSVAIPPPATWSSRADDGTAEREKGVLIEGEFQKTLPGQRNFGSAGKVFFQLPNHSPRFPATVFASDRNLVPSRA
jgi:hypothetical protein